MKFLAPAKLNLALRVVGQRGDGYHLLESVMVFFPWFDTLEFQVTSGEWGLTCVPTVTAVPEENLVWRAARLLARATGTTRGVNILVHKQIPDGAGLGGGSSDAAVTMLALNRLWGLDLPLERLIELGVGLGADIPFFLGGRAALVRGIGERLTWLPGPLVGELVVIFPGVSLATRSVFQALAGRYPVRAEALGLPTASEGIAAWLENDLELPACALCPEIAVARAALLARGARAALMSGSGSAVFGLFADADSATQAARQLAAAHPTWRLVSGSILNEHPFLHA
ncbi:MAG: 4-(cytidine 5'-diphospho)-2-C-methyl-D-erythritol kinase [Magnetococcales bacterium]|nr:4-(cytidine 5'-diphospho)-2-C-methyl-D-erythritol kinase [Magnetococcales bacterium]